MFLRFFGRFAASLAVLLSALWACLALWYQLPVPPALKIGAAVLWGGFGLAAIRFKGRAVQPQDYAKRADDRS